MRQKIRLLQPREHEKRLHDEGNTVRARAAWVDQKEGDNGGADFFDFRLILNYAFDLF